jgi:hypothetical protein
VVARKTATAVPIEVAIDPGLARTGLWGTIELDPIQLRIHRQAVRDVSFADSEQSAMLAALVFPIISRIAKTIS